MVNSLNGKIHPSNGVGHLRQKCCPVSFTAGNSQSNLLGYKIQHGRVAMIVIKADPALFGWDKTLTGKFHSYSLSYFFAMITNADGYSNL